MSGCSKTAHWQRDLFHLNTLALCVLQPTHTNAIHGVFPLLTFSNSRDVQPNPAVYDTASSGYNKLQAKPKLRAARAPPAVYDTASSGPPPGTSQMPRGPVYDLGNNADAGYLDISSES